MKSDCFRRRRRTRHELDDHGLARGHIRPRGRSELLRAAENVLAPRREGEGAGNLGNVQPQSRPSLHGHDFQQQSDAGA